jgi:magnesium chelatase subunit I
MIHIKTLGELIQSGYQSKNIKEELRTNLRNKLLAKQPTFTGVHGFENSVIPELERAILSRHNINWDYADKQKLVWLEKWSNF